jgi:hypothetical protein
MTSTSKWTTAFILMTLVYVLSAGPMHGLYYVEALPPEIGDWVEQRLYAPVRWMELHDPAGAIHHYKYWWYIHMQRWLVPPHVDPGNAAAAAKPWMPVSEAPQP